MVKKNYLVLEVLWLNAHQDMKAWILKNITGQSVRLTLIHKSPLKKILTVLMLGYMPSIINLKFVIYV